MPRFPLMPPPSRAEVMSARRLVTDLEVAQASLRINPYMRQMAWWILGDDFRQRRLARSLVLAPSCGGDAA